MSNFKAFGTLWKKQCLKHLVLRNLPKQQSLFIQETKTLFQCNDNVNNLFQTRLVHILSSTQSIEYNTKRNYSVKKRIESNKIKTQLTDEIVEKPANKNDETTDVAITGKALALESDDLFDEILNNVKKSHGKIFSRDCEQRLYEWKNIVVEKRNAKECVDLDNIISESIDSVADFVLRPTSPIQMRYHCLSILLAEGKDRAATQNIMNKTMEEVMVLPINFLADILQELSLAPETPFRKRFREMTVTAIISNRWYELPAKYVVFFMYQLDSLFDMKDVAQKSNAKMQESKHKKDSVQPNQLLTDLEPDNTTPSVLNLNLQTRLLNIIDELKSKDLAKVLVLLGRWKSRNLTVLNAVVHRLNKADLSEFSYVQLYNVLFACSVLNYRNEVFLEKVTSQLTLLTPESVSLACSVLTSLSRLHWKNDSLISACKKMVFDDCIMMSAKEARVSLLSLANLSELPSGEEEVGCLRELANKAIVDQGTASDKVTAGWCLAVLKSLSADQAKSLLKPEFIQDILASRDDLLKQVCLQKLAVINLVAKFEIKDYTGPFLSEQVSSLTEATSFCTDKLLNEAFQKAIGKFADMKTYVLPAQSLKDGVRADYIMLASRKGDVRPLSLAETEQGNEKLYRLALQLVPFSGVIGPCHSVTGSHHLAARFLKHLGYIPVHITYLDLKSNLGVVEQINNITSKIKSALAQVQE